MEDAPAAAARKGRSAENRCRHGKTDAPDKIIFYGWLLLLKKIGFSSREKREWK